MRAPPLQALLIAGLCMAGFAGGLHAPFIFDDLPSIVQNPYLDRLWPLGEAVRSPDHVESSFAGRPVASYSLALSHALSGRAPWGYHALSLALHVVNAWLLLGVLRRTLSGARLGPVLGTAAPGLAFAGAALWSVHPLVTEAVVYTSARSELLVSGLGLAALYASIRSFPRSAGWPGWVALAGLASLLAAGSKESAGVVPIVVLLYDHTFVSRGAWSALARHRALYAALAAGWLPLALLVASAPRGKTVGFGLGLGPLEYLCTQTGVLLTYLRLAAWPAPLRLLYEVEPVRSPTAALPELALVAGLGVLTLWGVMRRSMAAFPVACFFVLLAPTSSVVPIVSELAAEKRMYLPLAALVAGVVVGAWRAAPAVAVRLGASPRSAGIALGVAAAALCMALVQVTRQRVDVFSSEFRIWSDTLAKAPDHPWAHNNLGLVYRQQGDVVRAESHFRAALLRRPDLAPAWVNLGNLFVARGDLEGAVAVYREALSHMPDAVEVQYGLGLALARLGRVEEALPHFEEAVRIQPRDALVHVALSRAYRRLGRGTEARRHGEIASALGR